MESLIIIFPLSIEKKLFLKFFGKILNVSNEDILTLGKGKVDFAIKLQKKINYFKPLNILSIGSAGLINHEMDLNPGDIVHIGEVIEHDFKDKFISPDKYPQFKLDLFNEATLDQIKSVRCASGDEDILSLEDRSVLQKRTKADIVTWETAGYARVKALDGDKQRRYFEIRIITDDGKTILDKNTFVKNFETGLEKMQEVLRKLEIIS